METATFDHDHDVPLEIERHDHVMTGDLTVSELTYDHGAGGRARATLIVPARPNGVGVILAHGGTDDGRHFFVDEATSMAEHGLTALLTAYRLPPHGDQRASADAVRAAVLTQRRGLDLLAARADRLCYFGHSGGAQLGAILSAVEPRLVALALASYGSGTLRRVAAASLPQHDPVADAYVESLHRFEPAPYVAVPGSRRLLFQHGRDDEVVPLAEGLRLFHAAAGPKEWREYPCGHDTSTPPQARADRLRLFAATP
jgi:predicted esterase